MDLLQKNGWPALERYEPAKWLPHCSILKELSPADALKTVEICQNHSVTGVAKVIAAGLVEFRPRRVINNFNLKTDAIKVCPYE